MHRQRDILHAKRGVEICALIDENALYRRVGTTAAMFQQLEHLTAFIDHDHVRLAVIPRTVDPHPGLLGAFMVLEYDDPEDEPVVCFDGQQGNVIVRSEPGLADAYLNLSQQLLEVGYTGDSALAAIRTAQAAFE
jgi:hypothetical protein